MVSITPRPVGGVGVRFYPRSRERSQELVCFGAPAPENVELGQTILRLAVVVENAFPTTLIDLDFEICGR